jgi:hypothetical protein
LKGISLEAPTQPVTILEEAQNLVCGDRREAYGGIRENLDMIATMWNQLLAPKLNSPLDAQDVARLNIATKLARDVTGKPKRDNCVDIAGYAYLLDAVR